MTLAESPRTDPLAARTAHLLEFFATGPARLRQAVAGLTAEDLHARPRGPRTWSIHEIVMHVADAELQGAFRLRRVLAEPDSALQAYDQEAWATKLDYRTASDADRELALDQLEILRAATSSVLARATAEDWEKRGTHPEHGVMTLRDVLALYAVHIERHLEQILDCRRRLGQPLAPELLSPAAGVCPPVPSAAVSGPRGR